MNKSNPIKNVDMNSAPIIKFDNVCKTYTLYKSDQQRFLALFKKPKNPTVHKALDHVSLEIRRGESVGIMGDNGSGKSTMLKTITGVNVNAVNNKITFDKLSSNTLYYIQITYENYRNNVGYTESEKIAVTPFTDFTYTPIADDITLGTITAGQSTGHSVTLTYNGSSSLAENITKVKYTITLKGGSSKTTGEYEIGKNNLTSIFTFSADKTPRLKIDTSDSNFSSNTGFNFKANNTYIISTQYFYTKDGVLVPLVDQVTGNGTFTTILNL